MAGPTLHHPTYVTLMALGLTSSKVLIADEVTLSHPKILHETKTHLKRLLSYSDPLREEEGKQGPLTLLPASPQSARQLASMPPLRND